MVARTRYPRPRYLPMVFAFAGDSTITSEVVPGSGAGPSSMTSAFLRARGFAAFFAAVFFAADFLAVGISSERSGCRPPRPHPPDRNPREAREGLREQSGRRTG